MSGGKDLKRRSATFICTEPFSVCPNRDQHHLGRCHAPTSTTASPTGIVNFYFLRDSTFEQSAVFSLPLLFFLESVTLQQSSRGHEDRVCAGERESKQQSCDDIQQRMGSQTLSFLNRRTVRGSVDKKSGKWENGKESKCIPRALSDCWAPI